jgi:hypothetical protein
MDNSGYPRLVICAVAHVRRNLGHVFERAKGSR